jgi:hypothetical protein
MKRLISLGSILAVVIALGAPTLAGEASQTTLKGWIADSYCGAKNANAAGAQCTKDCAAKGAKLVLVADGKTYNLSDQKLALANVGYEVAVTGTVDKDGNVAVVKIEPVAAKKTSS